jgi:NAD(P)-dependent dehydrogenase (short-subunit alcohol dehydrogenase family)
MHDMNAKPSRVVLVTGASSGIGLACATHLQQRDYTVFGVSRQPRADAPFATRRMEVTDDQSVQDGIAAIVQQTGRLDVVINCAGFSCVGAVEDHTAVEAQEQWATNFLGTFRVCHAALPVMRVQHAGHIVNVGSIGGMVGLPFQGLYSAAEFAKTGLTEALRFEARPFGIHVTLIRAGDIDTAIALHRRHVQAAQQGSVYATQFRTTLSIMEKDERSGSAPLKIAQMVEKIITSKSPRGVYTVGPIFEVFAATARPFVPARFFEWALRKYYRLG